MTLIAGMLSAALTALVASRIRRKRADAAAGKHRRLSVGGLGVGSGVTPGRSRLELKLPGSRRMKCL
jgi:hypothetical protein